MNMRIGVGIGRGIAVLAAVALAGCATSGTGARAKRVLFVGADGLSAASFRAGLNAPNVRRLMAEGSWSLKARTILPSSSAANWASIFQCSGPELNGYNAWNSQKPVMPAAAVDANGRFPDVFERLRLAKPSSAIGYAYEWDGMAFVVDTNACDFVSHKTAWSPAVKDWILKTKPELMVIVFDSPDGTGHSVGWGTPEYMDAATKVDAKLGEILAAYAEAGILDDTAVVFTSDHGGIRKSHGGTTLDEMERPLVIAGPGIRAGHEIEAVNACYDTGATMAWLLGLEPPQAWTGRALTEVFSR